MRIDWNVFGMSMLVAHAAIFFFVGVAGIAKYKDLIWMLLWIPAAVLVSVAVSLSRADDDDNGGEMNAR